MEQKVDGSLLVYMAILDCRMKWNSIQSRTTNLFTFFLSKKDSVLRSGDDIPPELLGDGANREHASNMEATEESFHGLKECLLAYEEVLLEMIDIVDRAKHSAAAINVRSTVDRGDWGCALSLVDYVLFGETVITMYEKSFQVKESIVASLSFNSSQEELTTHFLAWRTQPCIDTRRLKAFAEKHDLSERVWQQQLGEPQNFGV